MQRRAPVRVGPSTRLLHYWEVVNSDFVDGFQKEMGCLKWIITNVFQYEMDWVRVPQKLSIWIPQIMSKLTFTRRIEEEFNMDSIVRGFI